MIFHLEKFLRKLRRRLSRSEWLISLFNLPRSKDSASKPGLILIQIDGLSRPQLEKALVNKRLPFLRRLLQKENYRLHTMYSGLPSTTPAVQGDLFYGVPRIVPAFNFYSSELGRTVLMFEQEAAQLFEKRLSGQGAPLLQAGSAYCNIYTGGAQEARYCASDLGLTDTIKRFHPLYWLLFWMLYSFSIVRIGVLFLIEVMLTPIDLINGLIEGKDFMQELKYIPSRLIVSIVFRELMTIGATLDAARGLPVIQLNFLGYDEQAHRRGPGSGFAHWCLKGIDHAIERVWLSAQRSANRHYDLWVYSDHGQESTSRYSKKYQKTFEQAVQEACERHEFHFEWLRQRPTHGVQWQRARLLRKKSRARKAAPESKTSRSPTICALGPLGHIYSQNGETPLQLDLIAQTLVAESHIPMVAALQAPGQVRVWNERGVFDLPRDAPQVFGADHPFLQDVAADFVALCEHPDAGDLVVSGWSPGVPPLTFVLENGSHGGPGSIETQAFALTPADAHLPENRDYLRIADLRQAVLIHLGRGERTQPSARVRNNSAATPSLRIMTYNIHSGIGTDSKYALERIGRIIARNNPDIVALQEVDSGRLRTGGSNQAQWLAQMLGMEYCFHPSFTIEDELYGNAILSRYPLRLVKAGTLPGHSSRRRREVRAAIWVEVAVGGVRFQILNTHLGLNLAERRLQAMELLGENWLGHADCRDPVIFCADLNALPSSKVYRLMRQRLQDTQLALDKHKPRPTWFTRLPVSRIDYIFTSPQLQVSGLQIPNDTLTRSASDHFPLIADLQWQVIQKPIQK